MPYSEFMKTREFYIMLVGALIMGLLATYLGISLWLVGIPAFIWGWYMGRCAVARKFKNFGNFE